VVPLQGGNAPQGLVKRIENKQTPGRAARGFFSRGSKHQGLRGQLLRAVPVSLASFAVDFGALAFLTEVVHLYYLFSAAVSFLLGTTLTWILSVTWVFPRRRAGSKSLEYGLFVFIGVIGLALNEAFLWAFTETLGLHYLLAKMCASTLVFSWNFGMRRALLFR